MLTHISWCVTQVAGESREDVAERLKEEVLPLANAGRRHMPSDPDEGQSSPDLLATRAPGFAHKQKALSFEMSPRAQRAQHREQHALAHPDPSNIGLDQRYAGNREARQILKDFDERKAKAKESSEVQARRALAHEEREQLEEEEIVESESGDSIFDELV